MLSLRGLDVSLRRRVPFCSRDARELVLASFRSQPPLSIRDLYERIGVVHRKRIEAVARTEGSPLSKSLGHVGQSLHLVKGKRSPSHGPITSLNYLKTVVLPHLVNENVVEKFHSKVTVFKTEARKRGTATPTAREVSTWKWRLISPSVLQKLADKQQRKIDQQNALPYGHEVGVGADYSHLNKRRQRRRPVKIAWTVEWMKKVDLARQGLLDDLEEDLWRKEPLKIGTGRTEKVLSSPDPKSSHKPESKPSKLLIAAPKHT